MSPPPFKVLITGAGIAGPCLAYWLARTGLPLAIKVVERSAVPRVTGQAIDIRGPALEIVKKMNLEEAVRSRTTTEEGTSFISAAGTRSIADFEKGDGMTAEYEILRADLCGLLLEATKDMKSIEYVYGESVQSLTQTETGVDVTFASSKNTETFDLIAAADGSNSSTRPLILSNLPPSTITDGTTLLGQYTAFFSVPRIASDVPRWSWFSAPNGLGAMLRPHSNPSTMGAYLLVTLPGHNLSDAALDKALAQGVDAQKKLLRERLSGLGWQVPRLLDGMDSSNDFYMSRTQTVKLPTWTHGRGVLLGDAAFATFGVATSMAIESAYILAGELKKAVNKEDGKVDVQAALKKYEAFYRPIADKKGDIPSWAPQIGFPQSTWGLTARNALMWTVSKTGLAKLLPGTQPDNQKEGWELPVYEWVSEDAVKG